MALVSLRRACIVLLLAPWFFFETISFTQDHSVVSVSYALICDDHATLHIIIIEKGRIVS
jgi:hypothetical protein